MSFINENSPVVALPELEVFETVPVQTSIEETTIQELIPQSQLNTGGHIEFIIKTSENEYIKPIDTILQTRFRVKLSKINNTAVTETDWTKVSIINNPGHSMWAQIDVSIGETQTNKPLHTHPYKAYIDTILHSPKEIKDTYLKLSGYIDDDFSDDKRNLPHAKRHDFIKWKSGDKAKGRLCEFWTPLYVDLFQQNKSLIGGLTIKIRLIPTRPEFFFMVNDTNILPSIIFEDIYLHVKERNINGDVALGVLQGLNISPAKYPINRIEVRTHTIDTGTTIRNLENIYIGTAPRLVYICFANNEAYAGSYTKNPFYFYHYNIIEIACFLDSQLIGRRTFKPDYETEYFGREYINLLKVSGQFNKGILTTITPEDFKKGYTIFAFDLTRDNSHGFLKSGYVDPPKKFSHLRFKVTFKDALTETISAIVYAEWDGVVMIDSMKNALVFDD
jgi:hypothetical protein